MTAPRVSVVVVTYRSTALLHDFAASLEQGLKGTDWDLIVVDNASDDDTVATARTLMPTAKVVEMAYNGGYAAGINAGVANAMPDSAVLVLNPDVRLRPNCVAILCEALDLPATGIAVPRLLNAHGVLLYSIRRDASLSRMLGDAIFGGKRSGRFRAFGEVDTSSRHYDSPRLVDWAEGSTMLLSRRCLDVCGPWDESFFLYAEETEFAQRARAAGFVVRFTPTAEATHLQGGSSTNPAAWSLLTVNRVRLYGRQHGPIRRSAFFGIVLAREASRALIGRQTGRAALSELVRLPLRHAISGQQIMARHSS